ncbi:MAG: hypothetical protein ACRDM9_06345 [Gaiellaceae bacterium]
MEEAHGSATLVEAVPDVEAYGVTTTLPRAEVEEVLRSEDGPIELFLDLMRPTDGEARTVRVAWDHDDLEHILESSSGDTVTLAFDRRQLESAFEEADVEGHGLRERALVLTVAVATAATGASVAQAGAVGGPGAGGGPGGAAAADVAGYQRAMPSDYAAAAAADAAGYQRAMPSDYGPTTGPVAAAGDESPAEVQGGAGSEIIGGAVGASGGEAPAAVTGAAGQPDAVGGAVGAAGGEAPATVTGGAAPVEAPADDSGGIEIPGPARDAAIAGGIVLLITAAGFALKGQRRVRPA